MHGTCMQAIHAKRPYKIPPFNVGTYMQAIHAKRPSKDYKNTSPPPFQCRDMHENTIKMPAIPPFNVGTYGIQFLQPGCFDIERGMTTVLVRH